MNPEGSKAEYVFIQPPQTVGYWQWHKDDNTKFCLTAMPNMFHRFMLKLILGIHIEILNVQNDKVKK